MPLDDRCGLDDGQRGSPVDPELGEQDPEDPVTGPQLGPFDGLLETAVPLNNSVLIRCQGVARFDAQPARD